VNSAHKFKGQSGLIHRQDSIRIFITSQDPRCFILSLLFFRRHELYPINI
jgi:hypothetical protein